MTYAWKIASGAENLVLQALQFQQIVGGPSMSYGTPNECFVKYQFNVST
jgi:hypothetical protein